MYFETMFLCHLVELWSEECERIPARNMSAGGKTILKCASILYEVGFGSINVPSSSGFHKECHKKFFLENSTVGEEITKKQSLTNGRIQTRNIKFREI